MRDQAESTDRWNDLSAPEVCPYCGDRVSLQDSKTIYGRSYGLAYICDSYPKCEGYVGVHRGTTIPLGTLANNELRELRHTAHGLFDPLWQTGGKSRGQAYRWLAKELGIERKDCHIAMFDVNRCLQVIEILKAYHVEQWRKTR